MACWRLLLSWDCGRRQNPRFCLHRDDGDDYYLRQLFTDRSCRHSGLAFKLLSHLESQVLIGKPLRLEVLKGNEEAIRFYNNRGYRLYCHTMIKDVDSG
ncbi:GNAT family N-acetyltransferase [Proteobacteria bacterium 005FR1]|nr:GNAT family N-acetyltransferase [Proteobacteria bacterium 005FR1]